MIHRVLVARQQEEMNKPFEEIGEKMMNVKGR